MHQLLTDKSEINRVVAASLKTKNKTLTLKTKTQTPKTKTSTFKTKTRPRHHIANICATFMISVQKFTLTIYVTMTQYPNSGI